MNKEKLLKHPMSLIIAFFVFLFVYSKFGPTIPFSVFSQDRGTPLMVEGTGKVSVVPDIAKISVGIEESGTTLAAVQKSANEKSKSLTEMLKKSGVEEKDIKTTNYSVFPEYDYQSRTPRITGYRVSISYEVKIRDFDKVNEILVSVTSAGANIVGSVSFEVNDETRNKKLGEAREEAVKEARDNAESLAKSAGVTLGKILNISESRGIPVPVSLRESGIGGTEPITAPDITPGETEISVTVSVSWEIR
ncbi:MAG TPA: SIMPL domain-containing protein [Patescibacteria group bacterium]|nr:SIMPL domain-containing protein [Patescibacteria group bacterium]